MIGGRYSVVGGWWSVAGGRSSVVSGLPVWGANGNDLFPTSVSSTDHSEPCRWKNSGTAPGSSDSR
ncbi:MAG: hypothetical protein DMG97_04915 [Acidobacteria bacterium]|nr:MAG: hypothetical protein DMG97_04915 [Acidobacteriota bacterium]